MLSTVCASYVVNARSPQNAFISFEAQHKIERAPAARVSRQLLLFYLFYKRCRDNHLGNESVTSHAELNESIIYDLLH